MITLPNHITSPRLTLRPFHQRDANAVFAYWRSDPGWARFNASVPESFTIEDAARFVDEMCARDRNVQPNWALLQSESVIGVVSLSFTQDHAAVTIGYGIHGDYRGQGLAAEAATTVIEIAFAEYAQLIEVRAHIDPRNEASRTVLTKLGFIRVDDNNEPDDGETFVASRSAFSPEANQL